MNFPTSTVNVLPHLQDLRKVWPHLVGSNKISALLKNNKKNTIFCCKQEKKELSFFYESNRVQVGPKVTKKVEETQEDQDD